MYLDQLKRLTAGVLKMIKNHEAPGDEDPDTPPLIARDLEAHLKLLLCSWRDQLMPLPKVPPAEITPQCHESELVINSPLYDPRREDENDIYVYSGYMEPSSHQIYIFDPKSGKFFKRKNVLIYPRKKPIKERKEKMQVGVKEKAVFKEESSFKSA
jgi:hypothetical protein